MNSFISRFFRKKTSRNTSTEKQDTGLNELQNMPSEPITDLNKNNQGDLQSKDGSDLPQLDVGVAQSVGIQRDHNEDAIYTLTTNLVTGDQSLNFGLYIVADGMGGHENGEIASRVAVDRLTSHVIRFFYLPLLSPSHNKQELSIQEIMLTGVLQAHQTIKKEVSGSGTTLTAALILGDKMTLAHVGDSRAYFFNSDKHLQLLTHDHSLVKRLEEIGQILPEQASTHPQRNVLYRALGQGEPFEPDIATFQFKRGSQLILCTDGLWGVISENEIEKIIKSSPNPQHACQALINLANSAGGPDNISVIIVHMPM